MTYRCLREVKGWFDETLPPFVQQYPARWHGYFGLGDELAVDFIFIALNRDWSFTHSKPDPSLFFFFSRADRSMRRMRTRPNSRERSFLNCVAIDDEMTRIESRILAGDATSNAPQAARGLAGRCGDGCRPRHPEPVSYLHIDCDMYESTKTVRRWLHSWLGSFDKR